MSTGAELMHYENESLPPKTGPDMTTRDLAEAIDRLIVLRQGEALSTASPTAHKQVLEAIEITIREIADGFKQHSGAKGVYVLPK